MSEEGAFSFVHFWVCIMAWCGGGLAVSGGGGGGCEERRGRSILWKFGWD